MARIFFLQLLLTSTLLASGKTDHPIQLLPSEITRQIEYFSHLPKSQPIIDTTFGGHSVLNISAQVVVGQTFGILFSLPPMAGFWASVWSPHGNPATTAALGILTISSYVFGTATGVYIVADMENERLGFWKTVGSSAIGAGAGVLLLSILATQYETIPSNGGMIVALSPLFGAVIYTCFIAD